MRVTIIATGFEVSNIPGLDDVVGKKTVDEAIKIHYEDTQAESKPKNEEVKESVEEKEVTPIVINTQPIVHESSDIVIDFGDDLETPKTSDNSQSSIGGFAGWMRGRR